MAFMPFGKALLCRETQRFWDFLGGVHPVELVLGFVSGLWRGIGESAVLGIVQVSVHVNVKSARGQIVALDLRSGLVLGDSYDDRVLQTTRLCRGNFFVSKSWRGSFAVWNCFGRDLSVCSAEQAYR